jgi:Zn-finger nucleic acid-binding protein
MTSTETRYPCPVCLGVKMAKITLEAPAPQPAEPRARNAAPTRADTHLVLDHCARCGGVWFEAGEVQRLRRCEADALWHELVRRDGVHSMLCHSCRSPLARTETRCGVCGWEVELDCPTCARPMRVSAQAGMRLDYCTDCRGVWFDHDELTGIWQMEVDALVKRRGSRVVGTAADGSDVLLDVLLFDPFVMYYGVHVAANVAGAAIEGLAHAGGSVEVIGEVAGAAGEAAAGVFGTIVEIIAGIFG